jgi:hypothetical protein
MNASPISTALSIFCSKDIMPLILAYLPRRKLPSDCETINERRRIESRYRRALECTNKQVRRIIINAELAELLIGNYDNICEFFQRTYHPIRIATNANEVFIAACKQNRTTLAEHIAYSNVQTRPNTLDLNNGLRIAYENCNLSLVATLIKHPFDHLPNKGGWPPYHVATNVDEMLTYACARYDKNTYRMALVHLAENAAYCGNCAAPAKECAAYIYMRGILTRMLFGN